MCRNNTQLSIFRIFTLLLRFQILSYLHTFTGLLAAMTLIACQDLYASWDSVTAQEEEGHCALPTNTAGQNIFKDVSEINQIGKKNANTM